MFWCEHKNTRKHISEHSWLSGWVILSILAHLAHLAQSCFSLIFSAINTYNYFQFDLIDKKDFNDWRQKHGEKWPMLMTFFLTATAAITGIFHWWNMQVNNIYDIAKERVDWSNFVFDCTPTLEGKYLPKEDLHTLSVTNIVNIEAP